MSDDVDTGEPLPPDEVPNAAEPRAIRRQRDTAKQREREGREFWQAVFSTKAGRREMWAILQSGGAFDQRFGHALNGGDNPAETQRQEGEHRFAFRVYLSWLKLDADGVTLMLRENEPGLAAEKRGRR